MATLEGISIRNFRTLQNVTVGRTFDFQKTQPLTKMSAFIGTNGCGKSTLMDAFGFLGDCLRLGVEEACDQPHRGGIERIRTRGEIGAISFEIYYRQEPNARPISYSLAIDVDLSGRPFVSYERLRQRRKGQPNGQPFSFLELSNGRGKVWAGDATEADESAEKEDVVLEEKYILGINSFGNLTTHPRIVDFKQFLEGWYLSYFVPDSARTMPVSGAQKHLDRTGHNLANFVQHMERVAPDRFHDVLRRVAAGIPGITNINPIRSPDGRLLLEFTDQGYADPFYAADMSDGTLKLFTYYLLLEDPEPAPLIGIEEPENGLHQQLLLPLAEQMRLLSRRRGGSQMVVTTHSSSLIDALAPDDVWVMRKVDGRTTVRRASDDSDIVAMVEAGVPLGSLWYSNHFGDTGDLSSSQ
jgi:predicted ATPase